MRPHARASPLGPSPAVPSLEAGGKALLSRLLASCDRLQNLSCSAPPTCFANVVFVPACVLE